MHRTTIFILGLLFFQLAYAGKLSYKNVQVKGDETSIARVGMFSPDDAPSKTPPGNGDSYINIDVDLTRQYDTNDSSVGVFVFHSDATNHIGVKVDDKIFLCCSESLFEKHDCGNASVGEVIWSPHPLLLVVENTTFTEGNTISVKQKYNIKESGMYYVYFVNCKASGLGRVTVDGTVTFMNPYGYLNGEMYYFMPFYLSLAIFYFLFMIVWLVLSFKHRKQLLTLQNCIAGVIFLGFIEGLTLYFDDLGYNISGENFVGAMIMGVIISTVKRTISRVLVLVVSLGYGVVKPTLGSTSYKIVMLGVLYFIFSGTLNIVELVQRTTVVSLTALFLLVFPVALLDTWFYWWIVMSLLRTISQLQLRKQIIKLNMYKRFLMTLIITGIVSSLMIVAEAIVTVSTDSDDTWQSNWIWTAFWLLFYLAILLAIAILWRPVSNNTRYAYSELGNDADIENNDGEITLQSFNLVTQRRAPTEEQNNNVLYQPKNVKLDEHKEARVVEIPVSFSIDDNDDDSSMERSKMD
mmetsp:Transcript_25089/g.35147  ORF Transcript_25089/g.35147 Transcript_25089/m.35147 type:complete len:522 (-) Transcript_25089:729-2294(-)